MILKFVVYGFLLLSMHKHVKGYAFEGTGHPKRILPNPPNFPLTVKRFNNLSLSTGIQLPPKQSLPPPSNKPWWSSLYAAAPDYSRQVFAHNELQGNTTDAKKGSETTLGSIISVILPNGSSTVISATRDDTPKTILQNLEKQLGYQADIHKLYYNAQELDKGHTLQAQGVPNYATFIVVQIPLAVVEFPNGRLFQLHGDPEAPLKELKKTIETASGIPVLQQALQYDGKQLSETDSLKSQSVPFGAKLFLQRVPMMHIRTQEGDILNIEIPRNLPLQKIKPLISIGTALSEEAQRFKYNGSVLDELQSLEQQKIPIGSIIDVDIIPGIVVVLPNEHKITVYVSVNDTIATVKRFLKLNAGLQPEEHECFYKDKILVDSKRLIDQNVFQGSKIYCSKKLLLEVISPEGNRVSLLFNLISPVSLLKEKLEQEFNISKEQQELLHNGKSLNDTLSLKSQNILHGTLLVLKKIPLVILHLSNGTTYPVHEANIDSQITLIEAIAKNITNTDNVTVSYRGRVLNCNKTLTEDNVPVGARIDVLGVQDSLDERRFCALRIELPNGTQLGLPSVSINDNVSTVRKAASRLANIDIKLLYYKKTQLKENQQTLAEQGVPNGAILLGDTKRYASMASTPLAGYAPSFFDCNLEQFGEECFTDPQLRARYKEFELRKHWVMIMYACILFGLGFLLQSGLKLITFQVAKSRDRFIRDMIETTYRSITIVALVIAVVEILLYFDIFEFRLEELLFDKFTADPALGIHENVLKETFGAMSQRVQFFLASYLVLVLLFALVSWRFFHWLQKIDRRPIDYFSTITASTSEKIYVALRYEFTDSVEIMAVEKLDPEYYNFMEYFLSCFLKTITKLVRLPNTMLLIGSIGVFFLMPFTSFRHIKMLMTMLVLNSIPLLILFGVFLRVWSVRRMLVPQNLQHYLDLRQVYAVHESPRSDEELAEVGPRYKTTAVQRGTICSACWIKFFYKTRYPNKHEALFYFWRAGPSVLERFFEAALFTGLCVIAQTFYLINTQWFTWVYEYGAWPLIVFLTILLAEAAIIPTTLWILTIVTSTSGIIREDILSEVWEMQRSQTVRRIAHLIDALRIEGTLFEIVEAGDSFMRELARRSLDVEPDVARQNAMIWESLDDDGDGMINLPQLYGFLTRQGLNIKNEAETMKWFQVFDVDKNGGIDRTEFSIIIAIAKQLTTATMDVESVKVMLAKDHNLDITAANAINENSFVKLLKSLHIYDEWNRNQIIHLFNLMRVDKYQRQLSISQFVEGLKQLESNTIATLTQAVQELKGAPLPHGIV